MRIALDTNVLLDQALADEDVLDAIKTIKRRLRDASFVVTATGLEELAWLAGTALAALTRLNEWGHKPLDVVPVGKGLVEQIRAIYL